MRSVAVKAKGPGSGRGYGVRVVEGTHGSTEVVPVDSYMAMAALRTPKHTPPVPHKRCWNRQTAASCRPVELRIVESPFSGVFLRMCQEHGLEINEDLRCPKGHLCTGDKRWRVQHALTGAVLYVDCSSDSGGRHVEDRAEYVMVGESA